MLRIISANLNGIRSACNKGFLPWMLEQQADFVCVQELKAQLTDLSNDMLQPLPYQGYFHYAEKKGYSGVGIYSRHQPDNVIVGLGHHDIDAEGRYLELQFNQLAIKKISIISLYLPSGSSGEERQQIKFSTMQRLYPHLQMLRESGREVVICGDWNIAHQAIDLKNWKGNQKNSGFLPEERAWMTAILNEQGWIDTYRHLYPDHSDACYTWWSNRGQAYANNVGWRIDYQIATPGIGLCAQQASIYKQQRFSDHAPLIVDYQLA